MQKKPLFCFSLAHLLMIIIMTCIAPLVCYTGCSSKPIRQAKSEAESIYLQGMAALEDEDYLLATEKFRVVKTKFLFSPFSALAELRLGDTAFAQGRHYEAIETFRFFIQSRPNHAEVPYAYWKIASSYNAQRPSNFFILPPTHERDRGPTKDALRALQDFTERYPQHEKNKKAQKLIKACRLELGEYELYVARFYSHSKKWWAARGRYEVLIERFKDQPELWQQGAQELVKVYSALKLDDQAQKLKDKLKSTL